MRQEKQGLSYSAASKKSRVQRTKQVQYNTGSECFAGSHNERHNSMITMNLKVKKSMSPKWTCSVNLWLNLVGMITQSYGISGQSCCSMVKCVERASRWTSGV